LASAIAVWTTIAAIGDKSRPVSPISLFTTAKLAERRGASAPVPLMQSLFNKVQERVTMTKLSLSPEEFRDNRLPKNIVPFNVQNIGGNLYVAFAQQDQAKNFVNFGAKLGAVDVFSPAGVLLQRLEVGS
jgi:hypothetical protein